MSKHPVSSIINGGGGNASFIFDNAQKTNRLNAPSFDGLVVAWKG